jgi:hypothetical protein
MAPRSDLPAAIVAATLAVVLAGARTDEAQPAAEAHDFVDYTFYPYAYDTFWPYAYDA